MAAHSVLLVFCSGGDKGISINSLPPLGVFSIAAYLEERGISTDIVDFSIEPNAVIHPEKYDVIGFSINISNRVSSIRAITDLRQKYPTQHIVVGGPLCMSNPELFFRPGLIDAVFDCEGEEAFYEYLTCQNFDNVKSV
jgi:radical SAM superfamily enzyme YgiQ (UPF0313 family)